MATKIYKIGAYELNWWARVKIDFDHTFEYAGETISTTDAIISMVMFWSGWQWKLKENHQDYTLVFLKNLTAEIIGEIAEHNYNLEGVLEHFRSAEGWAPMDGSAGITILEVDEFRWLDNFDFDIHEEEK